MAKRVLLALVISVLCAGLASATTIIATHTPGSPVLIGPATYSFTLDFPGASFPGSQVVQADFHFVFTDDTGDPAGPEPEAADVALTDGTPYMMVWDDVDIAQYSTITTLDLTWYPSTIVYLDGPGGPVTAASAFGYITNSSDDWDFLIRSSTGDFNFSSAQVTIEVVPEPATYLLLGGGLIGLALFRRRRRKV